MLPLSQEPDLCRDRGPLCPYDCDGNRFTAQCPNVLPRARPLTRASIAMVGAAGLGAVTALYARCLGWSVGASVLIWMLSAQFFFAAMVVLRLTRASDPQDVSLEIAADLDAVAQLRAHEARAAIGNGPRG